MLHKDNRDLYKHHHQTDAEQKSCSLVAGEKKECYITSTYSEERKKNPWLWAFV